MVMHWTKLQNRLLTSLPWWIIYHQFKAGRLIYLLVNYICEMACLISDVIYSFYILYQIGVTFSLPIILLWCWYGKTKAKPCNSEGFLNFYCCVIYFLWTPSLNLHRFFFSRHTLKKAPYTRSSIDGWYTYSYSSQINALIFSLEVTLSLFPYHNQKWKIQDANNKKLQLFCAFWISRLCHPWLGQLRQGRTWLG